MYKDLKDALKEPTAHLKYDTALYKKLKAFRISWMQKSPEYLDFLGGKLMGVQPIRFSTRDEELLFVDILELDMGDIAERIYNTEGIVKAWKISSNPYYNVILYLMYKYYKSKDINSRHVEEVITELFIIYYYKVIGSLLSHSFSYLASEDLAKATIEHLSNKSLIKKLDNWQELIVYRAKDILPKGLHHKALLNYNTDNAITILNDTQGRIRDLIKNIYGTMMDVQEANNKIGKTSLLKEDDDGVSVGDITNRPDKHITYLKDIIRNKTEFIDDDIVNLVASLTKNTEFNMITDSLNYICDNIDYNDKPDIIEIIIVDSIAYLKSKDVNSNYINNIVTVVKNLKGYWNNSGDKEKKLVKKKVEKMVKSASSKLTAWKISSVVSVVLIYIFVRAIVGKRT